jgi:hypothetical protein
MYFTIPAKSTGIVSQATQCCSSKLEISKAIVAEIKQQALPPQRAAV